MKNALDLNVWAFATIFGCTAIQSYALAYFLPIILKDGMGFGTAASQCLIAPPYVSSGLLMILFGWAADKYHIRSPFIIGCACMGLIGESQQTLISTFPEEKQVFQYLDSLTTWHYATLGHF